MRGSREGETKIGAVVVQIALTLHVAASALVSVIESAKDDQGRTPQGDGREESTAASSHDKAQIGYQKKDTRLKISDLSPRKPDPPLPPAPFQSVPFAINSLVDLYPSLVSLSPRSKIVILCLWCVCVC